MFIKSYSITSPTLVAGALVVPISGPEKVVAAKISFDDPFTTNYAFAAQATISGCNITITIDKQHDSAPGGWANAVTADLNNCTVNVMAYCE